MAKNTICLWYDKDAEALASGAWTSPRWLARPRRIETRQVRSSAAVVFFFFGAGDMPVR